MTMTTLYKIELTGEMYVVADSPADAMRVAEDAVHGACSDPDGIGLETSFGYDVHSRDDVTDGEWLASQPFGAPESDDRTVGDYADEG